MALTAHARATPWRVHAVLPRSRANGPGLRYVIWTQGCSLGCPGCFNPETHPSYRPDGPHPPAAAAVTAQEVADAVAAEARRAASQGQPLDGVTLTGGEPLEQPEALAAFASRLKQQCCDNQGPDGKDGKEGSGLGIVILTGFTRDEIERDPVKSAAAGHADMVIAGRYNARLRVASGLRGSSNKEYWQRSARYTRDDFTDVPEVELIIGPDGTLTVTGTPLDVIS